MLHGTTVSHLDQPNMTIFHTLAGNEALSLLELSRRLGRGRTTAFEAVVIGRMHAVKVGRLPLLVPVASAWLSTRSPARGAHNPRTNH